MLVTKRSKMAEKIGNSQEFPNSQNQNSVKAKKKAVKRTRVIVYSTPTCPWCSKAKEFLKENKVAFKDYDVSVDEKAREDMIQKSDQMGVPVLDINGTIIIGYDVDKMKDAIKK